MAGISDFSAYVQAAEKAGVAPAWEVESPPPTPQQVPTTTTKTETATVVLPDVDDTFVDSGQGTLSREEVAVVRAQTAIHDVDYQVDKFNRRDPIVAPQAPTEDFVSKYFVVVAGERVDLPGSSDPAFASALSLLPANTVVFEEQRPSDAYLAAYETYESDFRKFEHDHALLEGEASRLTALSEQVQSRHDVLWANLEQKFADANAEANSSYLKSLSERSSEFTLPGSPDVEITLPDITTSWSTSPESPIGDGKSGRYTDDDDTTNMGSWAPSPEELEALHAHLLDSANPGGFELA